MVRVQPGQRVWHLEPSYGEATPKPGPACNSKLALRGSDDSRGRRSSQFELVITLISPFFGEDRRRNRYRQSQPRLFLRCTLTVLSVTCSLDVPLVSRSVPS